ncbi:mediator of RNA polymerase II transcription subunit 14 [Paecilomyces variotii No. 5]|uniref:Mediator of RNA polymerase II transcription subunit 14 n=1 Tax=Byssochlamys spectabilis (strain No. 5 / NBRC 109023) TaxID=1356009 RepID=V5G9E9_BYSSN|nr:mediator of RNA polymerase II transcription subunit 14 [Paecilomyces variotii No. 5]
MPGIIMDDANASGSRLGLNPSNLENGIPNSSSDNGVKRGDHGDSKDRSHERNGGPFNDSNNQSDGVKSQRESTSGPLSKHAPELLHITQGFFPYAQLVNRSVQQCWNDLVDVMNELAETQVPSQNQESQPTALVNGKTGANQSAENVHKKMRLLEFAQAKRAEFIKLLVLSQWGRQAADVSKLIDIQNFIRTQHMAYTGALQRVGDMKRDLVQAQVANPDLRTAAEVLSKGKVATLPDLGYKPPKPLNAKKTLKTLQKINRIISTRLVLNDTVPSAFRTYRVHDGRVTFFVKGEFEIDLSIAEQNHSSQFFFIDLRFLYSPSSPIPKGRFFSELDLKINEILLQSGLTGCFDFVHNLVLTNQVNILFRQALALARGGWSDALHVELLHRTLIVQYWALKSGPRNWLEIGVKTGRHKSGSNNAAISGISYLDLRWMRDGKEVDHSRIQFNKEVLSMENVLRSAIALHTSHLLQSAYSKLKEGHLYASGTLALEVDMSDEEPGNCCLTVQLTKSRYLRVSVEPISGTITLSTSPTILIRQEVDRNGDKSPVEDIVSRVSRLRCIAAMEEVESHARMMGWDTVNPRGVKLDVRRIFPHNVLRFSLFSHPLWERNWIAAATSSMDGDHWWILQLKSAPSTPSRPAVGGGLPVLQSVQNVTEKLGQRQQRLDYASFANLEHSLAGLLALYANARYLEELNCVHSFPQARKLQLEPGPRVPSLFIRFEPSKLPASVQISCPTGLRKSRFLKETVCLSFQGIDSQSKRVIIVAQGQFTAPIRTVWALASNSDNSVAFQRKGCGFAMRFLVTAGNSMIGPLFDRLQRLECVLSILEALDRKNIRTRSMSLSRLDFTYGAQQSHHASIHIKGPELSHLPQEKGTVDLQSKASPLRLLLEIRFDHSNPHRRISQSLSSVLNDNGAMSGVNHMANILTLTVPLLQALDSITCGASRDSPSKVLVTARNAKVYQIYYPHHRYRFLITVGQHRDRITWILRDARTPQEKSTPGQLESKLRERIYNSQGDGWKGLGTGAVADIQKVGNLLSELDTCFTSSANDASVKAPDAATDQTGTGQRDVPNGQGAPNTESTKPAEVKSESKNDHDVIMID